MIVAQSSTVEIGRYWLIDYSFGEFSALLVDGPYSRFSSFKSIEEALQWLIP